jgi:hypothetical protein
MQNFFKPPPVASPCTNGRSIGKILTHWFYVKFHAFWPWRHRLGLGDCGRLRLGFVKIALICLRLNVIPMGDLCVLQSI